MACRRREEHRADRTPDFAKETKDLPAIFERGRHLVPISGTRHSRPVSDSLAANRSFARARTMDLAPKGPGRMKMSGLCVYEVEDGKMVPARFLV